MSCAVKLAPAAGREATAFIQHGQHQLASSLKDCLDQQQLRQLKFCNTKRDPTNSSFQQAKADAPLNERNHQLDALKPQTPPRLTTTFKVNDGGHKQATPTDTNNSQFVTCDKRPPDARRPLASRRRDSLESIQSRVSTSSGTAESQIQKAQQQHQQLTPSNSSRSVLVGTRYVAPPRLKSSQDEEEDDQRISSADWQTIDLNEAPQNELASRSRSCLARGCKLLAGSVAGAKSGAGTATSGSGQSKTRLEMTKSDGCKKESSEEICKKCNNQVLDLEHLASARRAASERRPSTNSAVRRGAQIGKTQAPFMFAGILASILGSVFFSMGMLCIKLLPDGQGLAEKTKIVCFRGCIMALLCGLTIIWRKSTFAIKRDELWVNGLRSLFGFTGVYGAYVSLKYISMGDSTALVFSSPIWTSLLSHFILNEPLQWIQLLALPASLVGIIFIAHPALLISLHDQAPLGSLDRQPLLDPAEVLEATELLLLNDTSSMQANQTSSLMQQLNKDLDIAVNNHESFDFEHRWKGIVIALATSFIVSFVYIVLKFRKSTPIQTTTFWLGITTICGALVIMAFIGPGQSQYGAYEWALVTLNGLCSWLGQVLLQWALAYEDASVLSVIRTLDVAMTFTLSAIFLHEEILWTSVLGAAIIATVVVSIMLNSWLVKRFCSAQIHEHEEMETPDEPQVEGCRPKQLYAINADEKLRDANEISLRLEAPPNGGQRAQTNEVAA